MLAGNKNTREAISAAQHFCRLLLRRNLNGMWQRGHLPRLSGKPV